MAVMIACLPLSGYLANIYQGYQTTVMKKTDARVQTTIEMMNVLRMIKMFGWEAKIAERLDAKRADELRWLRSAQLIGISNEGITLCVFEPLLCAHTHSTAQFSPCTADGCDVRDLHACHGSSTHS